MIAWVVGAVLAIGGAGVAYLFWFAGGSGEASGELTTPGLASTTTLSGATTTSGASAGKSFVIDRAQSSARFEIQEVLQGQPNIVAGATDQVAGQVRVDLEDLGTAVFSDIVVNARTLRTDSERRDRAIRGPIILDSASDEFELITLSVTSVDGLDGSATVGEMLEFTIKGDLTIKGTTDSVTFDVSVALVDGNTIAGAATAHVTRSQFGIGIPNVPGVADVAEEVVISLDFIASAS